MLRAFLHFQYIAKTKKQSFMRGYLPNLDID